MPKESNDLRVPAGDDVADVGDGAAGESGVGGGDQTADERSVYYYELVSLIREHGAKLEKNERVYSVQHGPDPVYVVANSPGECGAGGVRRAPCCGQGTRQGGVRSDGSEVMAAPKSQTLQQRFGFSDPDLSSPEHDSLMVWTEENIRPIAKRAFGDREWDRSDAVRLADAHNRGLRYNLKYECQIEANADSLVLPEWNPLVVKKTEWEVPIQSKSQFIVGFIDMVATVELSSLSIYADHKEVYLSGHVDQRRLCIEVKPSIRSAGELLRQMNMYRVHAQRGDVFAVVSLDGRMQQIIESQGVKFIRVPTG